MQIAERPAQPILVRRHDDRVNVVGHQAIGPDLGACPLGRLGQQVQIERIIALFEESLLPAVAALRHMMRQSGNDETGEASHGGGEV